jgi:hypothetical protein
MLPIYLFDNRQKPTMMYAYTTSQELTHLANLWQLLVRAFQASDTSLDDDMDLALLGSCAEICIRHTVCMLFAFLLGEGEYDYGKQFLLPQKVDKMDP